MCGIYLYFKWIIHSHLKCTGVFQVAAVSLVSLSLTTPVPSMGSGHTGFSGCGVQASVNTIVQARNRLTACGILGSDQESNQCPLALAERTLLHWAWETPELLVFYLR